MSSSKNRWCQEGDSGTDEERPFKRTRVHDAMVTAVSANPFVPSGLRTNQMQSHGSQDDLRSREQVKAVLDDYSGKLCNRTCDSCIWLDIEMDIRRAHTKYITSTVAVRI